MTAAESGYVHKKSDMNLSTRLRKLLRSPENQLYTYRIQIMIVVTLNKNVRLITDSDIKELIIELCSSISKLTNMNKMFLMDLTTHAGDSLSGLVAI